MWRVRGRRFVTKKNTREMCPFPGKRRPAVAGTPFQVLVGAVTRALDYATKWVSSEPVDSTGGWESNGLGSQE
jgi:hypothetical protein